MVRDAFFGLVLLGLTGWNANAAEMRSLEEYMALPSDLQEPSYLFVRCAGLYWAMTAYFGESGLGAEAHLNMSEAAILLNEAAILMRITKGGDTNHIEAGTRADAKRIATIYHERMRDNYALTGQAFYEDSLIKSDLLLCKPIAANPVGFMLEQPSE